MMRPLGLACGIPELLEALNYHMGLKYPKKRSIMKGFW